MPVAMPTWRNVLLAPEAMPARCGATTEMAADASTGFTARCRSRTDEPGQQHGPGGVGIGPGHQEQSAGDQEHSDREQ